MAHILIVDDEESICWGLDKLVRRMGHTASMAASAEQGFVEARHRRPDVLFLDVRLPGMDGLSAMSRFQEELDGAAIIVITAYGDLQTAVHAVRKGAFEYLVKPFDLAVAEQTIERALKRPALSVPVAKLDETSSRHRIVGGSPAIQEVYKRIAIVSPAEACVHIRGESGTGKELVARAIHHYSRRSQGPFVAVNAASLSTTLAESELFGHVRGAFTGADQSRVGLLAQAHGGTLFFDEVADIPLSTQIKLLRALEYGEILPVGSDRPVQSEFRVISATHQDLRERVAAGEFREDLYFRLVTFEIDIPPLRERRGDIHDLTAHFLQILSEKNGCPRPQLAQETLRALEDRPWHGNVRELRNALEHAIIVCRGGTLLPEHLPASTPAAADSDAGLETKIRAFVRDWANVQLATSPDDGDVHERLLRLVELPLFEQALHRNQGQYLAASRKLGMHRVTLKRRLDELRLASQTQPIEAPEDR